MAEPLVLIPGLMCDGRLFGPQIAALGRDRAVRVADITRAGTVPDLAAQVLADAPDRFALAGLSLGGIVAMEVIARAPARVTRLALFDTNPRAEAPEVAAVREPQIAAVRAGDLLRVMRDEMKPHYLAQGPRRVEVLDLVMQMAGDLGAEVFIRQSRALQTRPDQCEALKRVRVPTLVLCGEADALCPLHRHELIAGLVPGAPLVVVPGAGHLPTLEQPDAVIAAMAEWLAEKRRKSASRSDI